MNETKVLLILVNGLRCMGCGKDVPLKEIEWHHIVPRYVFKQNHLPIDNSYENGSLLCRRCHVEIHKYLYWDDEYQKLTDLIEDNKKPLD